MSTVLGAVDTGTYHAAEQAAILHPRDVTGNARGCLYFWGRGNTAGIVNVEYFGGAHLSCARAEIPVASCDYGSSTHWGNAASVSRTSELLTYFQANGAASGKVFILAVSMGATAALNWAKANITSVSSIALICPAVDLADIYTNNRGGYAAEISTAHGGAPSSANNPAQNTASITVPVKAWYSTDDTIIIPSTVTTYCTAVGGTAVSLGAVGHSAGTLDGTSVSDFFAAHP